MKMTVSHDVAAPADTLFGVLTDLDGAVDRIEGIEQIEVLEPGPGGNFGVGTKWKETRRFGGREATETMWITEFEPGRQYVAAAESHGAKYRTVMRAEPAGPDKSRVVMEFEGVPVSLMAKLMTPLGFLMKGMVRKCLEADCADIARAAEGRVG